MPALTHLTPYVTPEILLNAPTGISWKTIPSVKSDANAQLAEQMNICSRATSMVDTACNNIMRATIDTERFYGPDYRVTVNPRTRVTRFLTSRWPVVQALSARVSSAAVFPPQWTNVPATSLMVEKQPLGVYGTSTPTAASAGGQAIMMQGGYVTWSIGRNGFVTEIDYINGWPHSSLTSAAAQGASSIAVNDCTGWAPPPDDQFGAAGVIYDGTNQETISCIGASAVSGPGVLSLASPLTYGHGIGVVVSALPGQVMQATIMFAVSEALVRGATATTIQTVSGVGQGTGAGDHWDFKMLAHELIAPFKRII